LQGFCYLGVNDIVNVYDRKIDLMKSKTSEQTSWKFSHSSWVIQRT